jgi:putative ABC transport system permease protein
MKQEDASMRRRVPLREPINVALETLRAHKMRSFLMLLGIILSVSTLIVVIALISGVDRYIADRVANMGSNVFLLTRFPIITDVDEYVKANRRNKKVTWDDFESLRDNLKLPLRVGVELRVDGKSARARTASRTRTSAALPPTWWTLTSSRLRKAATFPKATIRAARWSP